MTTNYNGNATNVPSDRTQVSGPIMLGTDPPNAATWNTIFQRVWDYLQRIISKAGFLDIASSWTAKQTFTEAEASTFITTTVTATTGNITTVNTATGNITTANVTTLPLEAARLVGAAGQPTFANGAANGSTGSPPPCQFYKTPWGEVVVTGSFVGAKHLTKAINALPAGYLPPHTVAFYGDGYRVLMNVLGEVSTSFVPGLSNTAGDPMPEIPYFTLRYRVA